MFTGEKNCLHGLQKNQYTSEDTIIKFYVMLLYNLCYVEKSS